MPCADPDNGLRAVVARHHKVSFGEGLDWDFAAWREDQRSLREADNTGILDREERFIPSCTGKNDALVVRCAVRVELGVVRIVDSISARICRVGLVQDAIIGLVGLKPRDVIVIA